MAQRPTKQHDRAALPTGPTGVLGLKVALKHTLAVKQETCLAPRGQVLFRMLILSGVKETSAVTTATPLDLQVEKIEERETLSVNTVALKAYLASLRFC